MSDIKLDPRKLLGFKIIAAGEPTMALRSPKIGAKGCTFVAADQTGVGAAATATVGSKTA